MASKRKAQLYHLTVILNYQDNVDEKNHRNLSEGELLSMIMAYTNRSGVTSCVFTVVKSELAEPTSRWYHR